MIYNEILSGTKIKDLDNQLFEVAQLLENIYNYTGLMPDKKPKEDMKVILFRHIINTCGNLTTKEVLKAFELGISGHLQVDMNHYQNFSPLYFSTVINAYTEYRKRIVAQINKERAEKEAIPKELTKEEQEEINRRFDYNCIVTGYRNFLNTGKVDFGHVPIGHVYARLEEDLGVIKMTMQQKQDLYVMVKNYLPEKLKNKYANDNLKKELRDKVRKAIVGQDDSDIEMLIKEECRLVVIGELFMRHKEKDKDILRTLRLSPEWVEAHEKRLRKGK